ncbi:LPS translocon maturation chaperone LptM [Tepidicella xavieri]|uniref:LPS translocon maturation chaperone LptM n=1 Tax=Tepidicella xavieri TaxID=360241 RepID=UPI00105C8476|nr:lipoprotein [Tepidicella xavieri]
MFHGFKIVGTRRRRASVHRLARAFVVGTAALCAGLALTACGQKGPLYLPSPEQPSTPPDTSRR